MDKAYDLVCIGNYTKDTIITPAGTRFVDGGAVNYAAHAAARLGVKTAVVTRLAKVDARVVEKFKQAGVDCFTVYTPHSTLMKLEYPTEDPDLRRLSVAATAGSITCKQVEGVQARAAVVGSSLRGEVGLDIIQILKEKGVLVAADMQGFVRVLRGEELKYEPWAEMQATLAQVDIVKSDAVEAEFLTGETELRKAAQIFSSMGPKEVVLTHKDGVLICADGKFTNIGFFPTRLDGRSGRGDTCIGIYTAMRLSKPPLQAGVWAAAVTSLKMEDLGPFNRPIADVAALIHAKYNHGSIE
jgi:sugar/nucleoside kinase (ribokinase family)